MNSTLKVVMQGAAIVAVGLLVTVLVFQSSFLIGGIVSFLAGAVYAIVMIARSRGERPSDVAAEVVRETVHLDPGAGERRLREQLVRLNQDLRLTIPDLPVIKAAEDLIDLLLDVVPRAMHEASGHKATFDLEKLAEDHLPQLIVRYSALAPTDRTIQRGDLIQQLSELAQQVRNMKKALDAGRLDQFEASSIFLRTKFA